ncbi:uncharacterized protein [Spinacia oleracea]|uniref:Uncharacterized protein LOC110800211 isoform X2 n=1 Tax=Spinacia oleracea TaxID=3562 RepID=A0A9R0K7A0_SPIOL|nr:uncharacterized protein LOC110800211 isoform X2 [Spinacia oleracea]XP_056689878.1 uncharacterized protein LOC110800211 isoform X2 [Spinacia oleracea]
MDHLGNTRSISRDQRCTISPETKFASHIRQGSQQSRVLDNRISKEDELVRYMSNLPSYLEKGKNFQEKGLNVGVLDWRRLEKWRYSQKQMPAKQSGCSPSSSTTSLFSTDGSSTHSSKGLSCSPTNQTSHRLSLQSPLEASPKETHVGDAKSFSGRGYSCSPARQRMTPVVQSHSHKVYAEGRTSPDIEVFGGNAQKFQDSPVTGNNLSRQQRAFVAVQPCERQVPELKSASEMGKRQNFDKYEVGAPWKGKSKIQNTESAKETIRAQEMKLSVANQECSGRESSGAVVMPRDPSGHRCSSLTGISSFTVDGRLSVEPCQKSILVKNSLGARLSSKDDNRKHLEPSESCSQLPDSAKNLSQQSKLHSAKITQSSSKNIAQCVKGGPQASHISFPARILSSPTRSRNTEEKKPVAGCRSATVLKPSQELDARNRSESIPKARNPSPIRRLSFAMGKMIKNAGSRDNSPLRSSSKESVAKSGSDVMVASVSINNPCSDKLSTENNRGRSSPLRRLLDPLLKPRASNSSEPLKKPSSSMFDTINSCNEPLDFGLGHGVKGNSRPSSGTKSGCDDLKNGMSSFQALLQVSFKNGLPLFTFAIDNESNILAATVRKSSVPGKGHHSWTYTFFTIREVKRRSGNWFNQGGKGEGHGYVPNVVAQMKVSDSPGSFTKHDNAGHNITREFDLFAVDVGQGDQYATDFHPTNELAAIVVKLPKSITENGSKDDQYSYNWLDLLQDSRENLQGMRSGDNLQHQQCCLSLNLSTTVILPGGVHTVPSKGEISTLAERWRSGGSCDCGGWDLGCQLRVHTNNKEYEKKMGSSGMFLNKDKFQIFSQGNHDHKPVLSLAPFKERIYSVEFGSSLSLLQAFAICISFIDSRRPPELSEPSTVIEKIANEAGVFEVAMRTNQGEAPAKYVSYPPHSPVGRV